MQLFVDDEVEIIGDHYFAYPKGTRGKVISVNNGNYTLYFDNSNISQSLNKIDAKNEVYLINRTFHLNDRILYTGNDPRFNGLVGTIMSCGMRDCVVCFDVLTSVSVVQNIELEKVMAPSQQSQTPLHTYNGAGGIIGAAQQTLQTAQQYYTNNGFVTLTPDYSGEVTFSAGSVLKEAGCQHEWRDYIGLSKRMDICTKCPASKNERGIYE